MPTGRLCSAGSRSARGQRTCPIPWAPPRTRDSETRCPQARRPPASPSATDRRAPQRRCAAGVATPPPRRSDPSRDPGSWANRPPPEPACRREAMRPRPRSRDTPSTRQTCRRAGPRASRSPIRLPSRPPVLRPQAGTASPRSGLSAGTSRFRRRSQPCRRRHAGHPDGETPGSTFPRRG